MNRIPIPIVIGITIMVLNVHEKAFSGIPYENDFQSTSSGELPDGIMEIDGVFKVKKGEGDKKYLVMSNEPLSENAVILGPSLKGGASVRAKIRSFRKRRSYPRFAVGLHGISGFRLRVVPSKGVVELVKNEESVKSMPFKWQADEWTFLQLDIASQGDGWRVEGRVWRVGEKKPASPTVEVIHKGSPGQGKASLWGTAYSGREVQFDDVRIQPARAGS